MDDLTSRRRIGRGRYLYVSTLSAETLQDVGADHLGDRGFFIYEADERPGVGGIDVLAKAASFEAALRLLDVFEAEMSRVARIAGRLAHRPRGRPTKALGETLLQAT